MGKAKLTNEEVLTKGLRKAGAVIIRTLVQRCVPICRDLLNRADDTRGYTGFTGNTQTSYMCLICIGNDIYGTVTKEKVGFFFQPKTYVKQNRYTDPPLMVKSGSNKIGAKTDLVHKVRYDEWAYLSHPYEGDARSVHGTVTVNNKTGEQTSIQILNEYKLKDGHITILLTTGTEYSEYLEEYRHFDVIAGAYAEAEGILKDKLLQPLPANALK